MRFIGRIFLFVVSAFLIGLGIPIVIAFFTEGIQSGVWNFSISTGVELASVLIGVFGIICALLGKGVIVLSILVIALIGGYVAQIVISSQQGTLGDWKATLTACKVFALPLLVLTSAFLMKKGD